jgi:hypothetical protein
VAAAAATTLTSPVAAVFLGLVALVWAVQRRSLLLVAAGAAAPLAAIGLAFSEPGSMPFTWPVARPLLIACFAILLLCRAPLLRLATAVYAVVVLVVFLAPGPVGSNIERLGLLFTPVALAADAAGPVWFLVAALAVAGQWTARDPWTDLGNSGALHTEIAASHRLVSILDGLGPLTGRVEVVPFLEHGEADVVARHALLARGWERQLDTVRAAPLYRHSLDATAYVAWLRAHSVEYVALGRHRHDWSAAAELRLLGHGVPGLQVVHADGEWTVWFVAGSPAVVGNGDTVHLGPSSVTLTTTDDRPVRVDVRWSRWLTVSGGACLRPAAGGVVEVVPRREGTFTVSSSYLAPLTGRHC